MALDFGQNTQLEVASGLTSWTPAEWSMAPDWCGVVDAFFSSPPGTALGHFVQTRIAQRAEVYPRQPLRALSLTPLADVSVVILGQGELKKSLTVSAHRFSAAAKQKIEAAGGKAEVIAAPVAG